MMSEWQRWRWMNETRSVLLLILPLTTLACAPKTQFAPKLQLLDQASPYVYHDRDWADVLRVCVHRGLIDYEALGRNRDKLDRYAALLSVTGPLKTPEQFTTPSASTAFWINAYNASVLQAVLSRYPVATLYDLNMPSLGSDYTFIVDGQAHTLDGIEREMLTSSNGDVRVLFAASRAALGTPRLLDEPYSAGNLEHQLTAASAAALSPDNPDLFRIDHESRSILVWQLVLWREQDFLQYWQTRRRTQNIYLYNVLLDLMAPQYRRTLQAAVGYEIRPIPFDRRLNRWAPRDGVGATVP